MKILIYLLGFLCIFLGKVTYDAKNSNEKNTYTIELSTSDVEYYRDSIYFKEKNEYYKTHPKPKTKKIILKAHQHYIPGADKRTYTVTQKP